MLGEEGNGLLEEGEVRDEDVGVCEGVRNVSLAAPIT